MSAPIMWGLLDTQDNLWMGDDEGPKLWSNIDIARAAHTVASIQLGWHGSRLCVAQYDSHGAKRDEVPQLMDTLTALRIAEGESPRRARRPRGAA